MWLKLTQFRVSIDVDEPLLGHQIAKHFGIEESSVTRVEILRKSLDARHKDLVFVYTLIFEINPAEGSNADALMARDPNASLYVPEVREKVEKKVPTRLTKRPVVVGAGPAGLFAGLKLAEAGWAPIVLERGDGITARVEKVNRFWTEGRLDPESNIQFGSGGAGTFSDGKLTTRIKDPRVGEILDYLVKLGGPPEIRYWQSPHIGTDLLRGVVERLQDLISERGGEIRFRHRVTDVSFVDGKVNAVQVNDGEWVETDMLVMATGNGARDVYRMLHRHGVKLAAKPFAIGVRIEHPQDLIDRAQYGRWAGHPRLGPADYKLTYKDEPTQRGVYTFCMCPGGQVIAASSEPGGVVTNGMSYHARNSGIANAALVVTVNERDFGSSSPLAGVDLQINLEERAFQAGGKNYYAPAQQVGDFLQQRPTTGFKTLKPSYTPGVTMVNLWDILPREVCQAMSRGIKYFGRLLRGFDAADAVLTGIETRTSAPVRIVRNEAGQAEGCRGLYPVGEGAGYAGGIISSAVDGWKTAERILEEFGGS